MLLGRIVGYVIIGVAMAAAVGDLMVLADTGRYQYVDLGEAMLVLTGVDPATALGTGLFGRLNHALMILPFWAALLPLGVALRVAARRRRRRLLPHPAQGLFLAPRG